MKKFNYKKRNSRRFNHDAEKEEIVVPEFEFERIVERYTKKVKTKLSVVKGRKGKI